MNTLTACARFKFRSPTIYAAREPSPSRAMRGNLQADGKQSTVMDILDDPIALAMLAVLIDEASE